jgi:hypothetical protein
VHPRIGFWMFRQHLWSSVEAIFRGEWLELGLRLELLAIAFLALGVIVRRAYRHRRGTLDPDTPVVDPLCALHVFNLVPVGVIVLALYDLGEWRDFRVIAPHVMVSVLASIPFVRGGALQRVYVRLPLVVNAVLVLAFVPAFNTFHKDQFSADLSGPNVLATVPYVPGASPWENTVLIDAYNNTTDLLALPPGVGVSLILGPYTLHQPIKSRYLLVNDHTLFQLGNPPGFELLGAIKTGKLYRRVDALGPSRQRLR